MKEPKFKIPNALLSNTELSYTDRVVGATLYAHRNALGWCRRSAEELAVLSGCGEKSVRNAIPKLIKAGYIQKGRSYRYLKRKKQLVYGKNVYICNLKFEGGFTLIPRHVLTNTDLTPAAMCVYLYLYRAAGNERRAYPCLTEIETGIGAAHSTVCRVLKELKKLPGLLVQHCIKACHKFSRNSYYLLSLLHFVSQRDPASEQTQDNAITKAPPCLLERAIIAINRLWKSFSQKLVVRFLPNFS